MTAWTWLALAGAIVVALVAAAQVRRHAAARAAGRRFLRHPTASLGVFILAFFVTLALAAPLVAPYDPTRQLDPVHLQNQPPSLRFLLGTDVYSRDVWSRLVYGARLSLGIGTLAMLVAVTVGAGVGAVAGYFRHWLDAILMRGVDVGLAEVLSLRERECVAAAQAVGAGPTRVILRHVLPNAAAPIIVSAALGIGNVILLEAGLSFLGIGVPSPLPSWGSMIHDGWQWIVAAPWTSGFPGLAIAFVVMALTAVGDGLRDALDPRDTLDPRKEGT